MGTEECRRYRDEDAGAGRRGEAWRRHLRECSRCARQSRIEALLREGYGNLREPRLSRGFDARLQRAVDAARAGPGEIDEPATAGIDARPGTFGRWVQRLYWVAAGGVAAALVARVVEAAPGPVALAVAAVAGLLLGVSVIGTARALRAAPGLLIVRSL